MKTSKIAYVLIFLMLASALNSCSKEFDWWQKTDRERFIATIEELQAPEEVFAGEPAVFFVTYQKPQPCYTRKGIHTVIQGMIMGVEVEIVRNHGFGCPDVLVGEKATFAVIFPFEGVYLIRFKGPEGIQEMQLKVSPK